MIIDGYTQGDATANTGDDAAENTLGRGGTNAILKIELNGTGAGQVDGLRIEAKNSVVRGLAINRFREDGIRIAFEATGNRIEGNFLGTDTSGNVDLGMSDGIFIGGTNNTVGGAAPARASPWTGSPR